MPPASRSRPLRDARCEVGSAPVTSPPPCGEGAGGGGRLRRHGLGQLAMPWHQPPRKPVEPRAARQAKALRRSLTEPERRLWWHLRHRLAIEGTHFRRQVALGSYVVDFCCLARKLIFEVDGNQHGSDQGAAYDGKRTALLEAQGFRVLRFSNFEVMRG